MSQRLRSAAATVGGRGRPPAGTARRAVPPAAVLTLALAVGLAAFAAAVLAPVSGPGDAEANKSARPNVVVVMTDDQTVESMRVMENVDSRLAEFGATFAHSFVNLPICCPSRATFLSGQYAHNHGTLTNRAPQGGFDKFHADHGANTLPGWLQAAGYHTVHVGKYLNGYGSGDTARLVPPGWSEWYTGTGGTTQRVYDYTLNENGRLVEYGESTADFKQDVFTARAVDVIERRAPARKPFFLTVDYTAPHSGGPNPNPNPPGDCGGTAKPAPRHATALDGEPLPEPPSFNEQDVSDKPPDIRSRDPIGANRRNRIATRYRCRMESILSVDEGVGEIVDALRSQRELGDTLVVFTSDNGFFAGEHRVPSGKLRHYEPSSRVPLILRGPGVPKGKTVRALAVNADLAKTILDAAGADPGLKQDGRSLLGLAKHPRRERGREILIETTTYAAVRTARYMYVEHDSGQNAGARELYDLGADPFELQSRHASPAHAKVKARLAARLAALRHCAGRSCRTKPKLKLKVRKRRGCVRRPARARVKGRDVKRVEEVEFRLDGRRVGRDRRRPFRDKLPYGKLKRKGKSKLRASAELIDGRRMGLDRRIRACRR